MNPAGTRQEAVHYTPHEPSKKKLLVNNFLAGIAWGVGTSVGIAVGIAVFAFIVSRVNFVPIVGNWLADVLQFAIEEVGTRPPTVLQ